MENLIPVLIMIVVFIFQAINNYRKEQEKARKRNTGAPRPAPTATRRPIPQPVVARREEEPGYTQSDQPRPSNPYEAYQGRLDAIDTSSEATASPAPLRAEAYRLPDPENDPEGDDELERIRNNFNMKEAVIMSAILERPYA